MIGRRDFIAGLGSAAVWPVVARAQQPALPVVGFLDLSSPIGGLVAAFRQDLKEAGYIEGQNVAIEFRWPNNNFNVLPDLAADLVRRRVAVIVASGVTPVAVAARDATSTIPIVFSGGADPVKYGLVASLSHPGGNITGVTSLYNEVAGKRLDMLSKLVPHPKTFGYLVGYQNDYETNLTNDLLGAARTLGLEVIVLQCLRDSDIEAAFTLLAQRQVSGDAVPWKNWRRFLELCVERGINQHRAAGGLSVSIVLFDRSLIDNTMDDALSDHLRKIRNDHRYDSVVYFTPPWPEIYRIDNERRHDFACALEDYARLQIAYPALGYQVVEIPKVSVSERADWLSERLKA